jgi:hypothetical protein
LLPPATGGRKIEQPSFEVRVVKQKANISLKGARGWAYDFVDDDNNYDDLVNDTTIRLFLVFLSSGKKGGAGGGKGHAFLLKFEIADDDDQPLALAEGGGAHDIEIVNDSVASVALALIAGMEHVLEREHMQAAHASSHASTTCDDAARVPPTSGMLHCWFCRQMEGLWRRRRKRRRTFFQRTELLTRMPRALAEIERVWIFMSKSPDARQ